MALFSGQKTFTTTAGQLVDAITKPATTVVVKAAAGNAGNLFVGGPGVSTTVGIMLDAGQEVTLEVETIGEVWCFGSAADQVAEFIAATRPNLR